MIPTIDPYITQAQNEFMKTIMNSNLSPVHHFSFLSYTPTPSIPNLPHPNPNYPIMQPKSCLSLNPITSTLNYNMKNIRTNYNRFQSARSTQNCEHLTVNKKYPFSNSNNTIQFNDQPKCSYQSVNNEKDNNGNSIISTYFCNCGILSNMNLGASTDEQCSTLNYKNKRKMKRRNLSLSMHKSKQKVKTKLPNLNSKKKHDGLLDQFQSRNNNKVTNHQLKYLMNVYKNYVKGLIFANDESTDFETHNDVLSLRSLVINFEEKETDCCGEIELCYCKIYQTTKSNSKAILMDESLKIKKEMWDTMTSKFPDLTENRFKHLLNMLKTKMKHVCFDFAVNDESNKENEYPIDLSSKPANNRKSHPPFNVYRSRTPSKLTKFRRKSKTNEVIRL